MGTLLFAPQFWRLYFFFLGTFSGIVSSYKTRVSLAIPPCHLSGFVRVECGCCGQCGAKHGRGRAFIETRAVCLDEFTGRFSARRLICLFLSLRVLAGGGEEAI